MNRQTKLPLNPFKTLKLPLLLHIVLFFFHRFADIFRLWDRPRKNTAASFELMSLIDKIYWTYKSKKPIVKPEKKLPENIFGKSAFAKQLGSIDTERVVTVSAVGDLIRVPGIENSAHSLYEGISAEIFKADISMANLESQLWQNETVNIEFSDAEAPALDCNLVQYQALVKYKSRQYTILNTACNHSLDRGLDGLKLTIDQLEKDGIINLGTTFLKNEYKKAKIIEKNGIKIGLISATFGLNGKPLPEEWTHVVNLVNCHARGEELDLSLLDAQCSYCREKACDFIIANLHWGYEYEFFPRYKQVETAHRLIESGIDLLVSHHAHVLQPYEMYTPVRAPHKASLITYSLGNLTYPFSAPPLVLSCVLNFSIIKGKINGQQETFVDNVRFIPVIQVETELNGKPGIQLKKLSDILKHTNEVAPEILQEAALYADLVLGKDWRNG